MEADRVHEPHSCSLFCGCTEEQADNDDNQEKSGKEANSFLSAWVCVY
jgi:hypothetical protein